jgi:peptide subunit release factor 1 (eRF1)
MRLTKQVLQELVQLSDLDRTFLSAYLNLSKGWDKAKLFVEKESVRLLPLLDAREKRSFETSLSALYGYLKSKRGEKFSGPGLAFFADLEGAITREVELFMPPEALLAVDEEFVIQPLALQLDEYEPVGIIMIDANCTKILVAAGQVLETKDAFCEKIHQLSKPGGWSQMRFQRRHRNEMKQLAKDAVKAAQVAFDEVGVRRIVVAGRDRMVNALEAELPKAWENRIAGRVRWDLDAPGDELLKKIRPILEEAEREQERNLLEKLVAEIRRGGLGIAGAEETRGALRRGQVDTLVLSDGLDSETSEELVSLANSTGAQVEFIPHDKEDLSWFGNVGALLRFKL